MRPKFPTVHVRLTGEDGNAFAILGKTRKALRRAKVAAEAIEEYTKAATSGDYNNLLRVTMETVDVS